jgi:hypothetical protein
MAGKTIPTEIQQKATKLIETFNKKTFKGSADVMYIPRFKGKFLYLDRHEYGKISPVVRLTYTGDMDEWEFAIYKWSREAYDPEEWFFPGAEHVDGTIEGAMKAGLAAYPI